MPVLLVVIAAALSVPQSQPAPEVPEAVATALRSYREAMEARSVERLAAVFDPDLFLFEGTHVNAGWPDYRDNHIGPEMKEWSEFKVLETRLADAVITADLAYVATSSTYRIAAGAKSARIAAAESFVLVRRDGKWRIRHLHYSGKKL